MRVFIWNPNFRPYVESSLAPVWTSLPNLPLFFSDKQRLFSIGKLIDTLLTHDAATAELSRTGGCQTLHRSRFAKESTESPECGETFSGFWQDIIYEKVPTYCKHSKRLGHDISICTLAHLELAKVPDR